MAHTLSTSSTSEVTATVNDLALRTKQTARLVFRPTLVDNPNNPAAAVKGTFVYQRKSRKGVWEDYRTLPLSKLRANEWIKLDLSCMEVLHLFHVLGQCYDLHSQHGVPRGRAEFVAVPKSERIKALITDKHDLAEVLKASNYELLITFVKWLAAMDPQILSDGLAGVSAADLLSFDALLGVARLKQVLATIDANIRNSAESFWHNLFQRNAWVLSQLFAYPVISIGDKVYVGGKGIDNKGGNVADFAYKNELTDNIALVEIKTPTTPLLATEFYRQNAYGVSGDLAGATAQVLEGRSSLMEEYTTLVAHSRQTYKSWLPECVLLIGNVGHECGDEIRLRSFELYRRSIASVRIVTCDELRSRIANLVNLLESPRVAVERDSHYL